MTQQSIVLDVRGLSTYPSDISGSPVGSQSVALNVSINRLGIVEPRRGYDLLTYGYSSISDRAKKLFFWNGEIFSHYGSLFAYYNTGSGWSSRGSLTAPSYATSVRAVASQNKNLYVTSDSGLKKTDAIATSLYAAGVPKGLTIDLSVAGAGTALSNNYYATYRYLLARKDANSNQTTGGVSGRFTIQNTAGSTQNITARCYLPSGLDTTYFLQLYKCPESAVAVTLDELQLCYETPLSSGNISAGYVDVTDIVPDALLGATIYSAPSQQGLVNDSTRPPLARDIAEWKNCLWYADVDAPQRLIFSLISVSGTGFVAGDTITLTLGATTEVYTGHATTFDSSLKQFVVSTGGSSSQNIDNSIKSFLKCVNLASAIVYGYSMTEGYNDLPGKVLLEARSVGTATFTAVSSRATAFQPQLPATATINNTSAADTFKHGLMFSKPFEPEAVPIKNLYKVGSSDDRIKRIVASRDALFVFKERDGLYVVRGESEATFAVSLLDNTAKLVAPDSIATVNNSVYMLAESGICECTETGVSIISTPIKDQLLPLYGAPLAALKAYSFGFGSDSDGKYVLAIPEASTDTYATKQIIFDAFGRSFVTWNLAVTCGGINPIDGKTYLGSGDSKYIKQERKAFDYTDYADFISSTLSISAYTGTELTISGTSNMAAGDIIYQGDSIAYITAVDSGAGMVTIDAEQDWVLATSDVTHLAGIHTKLQWNPDVGGNTGYLKHFYEASLIFKNSFSREATVYYTSDLNPSESSIVITSASGNGEWGSFAFGDEVFGGEQSRSPKRLGIPRPHARCSQLSVRFETRNAYSDFQLTGLALSFNPTSTRTTR